jgi:hypothetical protein
VGWAFVRHPDGEHEEGEHGSYADWKGGALDFVLPVGTYALVVGTDAYAPFERELDLAAGQRLDLGDVRLEKGVRLDGRVVDGAGKPVAGLRVGADVRTSESTESDVEGRFRFERMPRRKVRLSVRSEDWLELATDVDLATANEPVTLGLRRGGVVVGTVRTAAGGPGAQSWVRLTPAGRVPEDETSVSCTADEAGRFRQRLAPGRWVAEVLWQGDDDPQPKVLARADVTVVEGADTPVELKLP